jgi:hypothetical protein
MKQSEKTEIVDYLAGKSVCIVGNATAMLDKEFGERIDSYDVVVRMNRAATLLGQHKIALGKKTKILTAARDVEMSGLNDVDFVIWLTGEEEFDTRAHSIKASGKKVYFYNQQARWYIAKHFLNDAKPTSGLMTLDLFDEVCFQTDYDEKIKIDVFGFDFFNSASVVTMQNNALKWGHNPSSEKEYAMTLDRYSFIYPEIE